MVEALRDIETLDNETDNLTCEWNVERNREYKSYVAKKLIECKLTNLSVYKDYDINTWNCINRYNWRKGNFLIKNEMSLPNYEVLSKFSEEVIFENQVAKMHQNKDIVTLSGFSFFIASYFRRERIEKILENNY